MFILRELRLDSYLLLKKLLNYSSTYNRVGMTPDILFFILTGSLYFRNLSNLMCLESVFILQQNVSWSADQSKTWCTVGNDRKNAYIYQLTLMGMEGFFSNIFHLLIAKLLTFARRSRHTTHFNNISIFIINKRNVELSSVYGCLLPSWCIKYNIFFISMILLVKCFK